MQLFQPVYCMMNNKIYRRALWGIFVLYLAVLIKLIFYKSQLGSIDYHYEFNHNLTLWQNYIIANFTPLKGITNVLKESGKPEFIIQNLGGNILVFMPLGILVPLLFPKTWSFKRIVLTGFLTSLLFEIIQLFAIMGCFDVDDILLNTIGTALGYLVLLAVFRYVAVKFPGLYTGIEKLK